MIHAKETPLTPQPDTLSAVRQKYGSVARSVAETGAQACCDPALRCCDPITKDLYSGAEHQSLLEPRQNGGRLA